MTEEFDGDGNIDPHANNEMRVSVYIPSRTTTSVFAVEQDGLRPVYVPDPEQATTAARSILAFYGIE